VFGGPADHQDTLTVIDTATAKTTPATAATLIGPDPAFFSRPVSAVFSSDGSKAYILNCGAECGGMAASVTVLDMTKTPPAPTTNIPVAGGASTGLLNGNTLYVAGTPSGTPGLLAGRLSVLDTTALAPPASSVPISDGFHNHMELGSNNRLFIGAIAPCSNDANTPKSGCLSIYDTAAKPLTAVVENALGYVTGIAPISGRNIVYVVEGGELKIYDTTTDALTPTQIDVVGKAVDVKYVDH
jgi:DNA-binding beta-propeller fold protein YncE